MPSFTSVNLAALIVTVFALMLVSVGLPLNLRREPRRSVLLLAGMLIGGTGALLGEIARMAGASHSVLLAVDPVCVLLALGGLACILAGITRSARVRSGSIPDR
jgi:NADH:ubiquinone oxidoreductase subunit 6 (subunit J)